MSKLSNRPISALRFTTRSISRVMGVCTAAVAALMLAPEAALAACDATCQTEYLDEHNRVRTRLNDAQMPAPGGTQPTANPPLAALTSSQPAADGSQAWANACTWAHSSDNFRSGRGENLFASAGTSPSPAVAVKKWEDESALYVYGPIPAPNQNQVGHYTQLVWTSTTAVGCGTHRCTTGSPFGEQFPTWDIVVCQYSPPGNVSADVPYVRGVSPPPVPGGPLDIDGNGQYDALTDGLIILRYLFGLTGPALTNNAIGAQASTSTPEAMLIKLNTLRSSFDIDGNGLVDALTDGLLVIRYLFGVRGPSLIAGAIGPNPSRSTAPQVETYLQTLRP